MRTQIKARIGLVAVTALTLSCKTSGGRTTSGIKDEQNVDATDNLALDEDLGEVFQSGEDHAAIDIKGVILNENTYKKIGAESKTPPNPPLHPPGSMYRRDAHPKAHGCVDATFEVLQGIDTTLAKGIFATPKSYNATIRYSNGSGDPTKPDSSGDGRGMAIKVKGVTGDRLLAVGDRDSQDFVMINYPLFFVKKPSSYLPIVKAVSEGTFFDKARAAETIIWEPRDAEIIFALSNLKIANPLHAQYWSEVPYRLGKRGDAIAIKFSAKPVACAGSDFGSNDSPDTSDHDFLRAAMAASLDPNAMPRKQACFDFMVQQRQDGEDVEDPRYEWQGDFTTVAKITIKAQNFNTPDIDLACEKLSYSPWDGLVEHKPLSGVNRIRRVVYEAVSNKRHGIEK